MEQISLVALVLGALIGFGIKYYLQKSSFKLEYYKKVIDKRLIAYESLDEFLNKCFRIGLLDNNQKFFIVFQSYEFYKKFFIQTFAMCHKSTWFSTKVTKELLKLNDYLPKNITGTTDKDVKEQGIKSHEKLLEISNALYKCFIDDIEVLHDVNNFIKQKKKGNETTDIEQK